MNSYKEINEYGTVCWYKNGTRIYHREDGPAIEFAGGAKLWYYEGKRHRLNGPASEYIDDNKFWWYEGKRHRIDGPACEYSNGNKEWFYYGEEINCSSQEEFEKIIGISKQSIIQEASCRQCSRKNDIGVSKCWFCECPKPC